MKRYFNNDNIDIDPIRLTWNNNIASNNLNGFNNNGFNNNASNRFNNNGYTNNNLDNQNNQFNMNKNNLLLGFNQPINKFPNSLKKIEIPKNYSRIKLVS